MIAIREMVVMDESQQSGAFGPLFVFADEFGDRSWIAMSR
jgi:hypothetical protein